MSDRTLLVFLRLGGVFAARRGQAKNKARLSRDLDKDSFAARANWPAMTQRLPLSAPSAEGKWSVRIYAAFFPPPPTYQPIFASNTNAQRASESCLPSPSRVIQIPRSCNAYSRERRVLFALHFPLEIAATKSPTQENRVFSRRLSDRIDNKDEEKWAKRGQDSDQGSNVQQHEQDPRAG